MPPASVRLKTLYRLRRLVYTELRRAAALISKSLAVRASLTHILPVIALAALLFVYLAPSAHTDQPSYDTVGTIEGETISVQGPMNIEVVQGRTRTILRSGSDIRLNSGQARIDLVEGGQIAVCGPAHLSVLKSVNLLTVALDAGIIHARIPGAQPALTVYTAQLQAKPFAISDAPQDALVGFDPTGAMCIRADSGAVRVEQQLTAQSIIVPQSGEVLITNGQLENLSSGVTHCACELQLAKTQTPASPQAEVSRLPTPEEMQKANMELAKPAAGAAKANVEAANPGADATRPGAEATKAAPDAARSNTFVAKSNAEATKPNKAGTKTLAATPKPAANDGPVYQVFMPPLSYDANAKAQPDNFDPQLIVFVHRVRVRPALIFQGTVKDAPAPATNTSAAPPPKTSEPVTAQNHQPPPKTPQPTPSVIDRIRAFFRNLFS